MDNGVRSEIILRYHEANDLRDVYEMNSDPLVQAFLGGVKSMEESERGLAYAIKNRSESAYPLKAIVHVQDRKVIGYCGMQPLADLGPEIFYGLNSNYWGRGYCLQAVRSYLEAEAQGIARIFATVHPDNARSRKVLEKLGFRYEKDIYYEPRKMEHRLYIKDDALPGPG